MSVFVLLTVVIGVVVVGIAVVAVLAAPKQSVETGPHCGHCGYNLTGATSNRCPECGKLFIEAGVVIGHRGPMRRRTGLVITAVIVPLKNVLVQDLKILYSVDHFPHPVLTQFSKFLYFQ